LSLKQAISDCQDDDEDCRPWRHRLSSSMASFSWASLLRITIFLLLVAAAVFAFFTLPVEKVSIFLLPFLSLSFLFSFLCPMARLLMWVSLFLRWICGVSLIHGVLVSFSGDAIVGGFTFRESCGLSCLFVEFLGN